MSILNIDLDTTVAHIVEAMLPRFSDSELGLLFSFDLGMFDYGYGEDGNTKERKELHVRRFPHMLFVRPSNYTKVYWFESEGMGIRSPLYEKGLPWQRTSDHDSCWRSDGFTNLPDVYFQMHSKFKNRKIPPNSLHQFHHLNGDPKYVRLLTHEQLHKDADQYSKESWIYTINLKPIGLDELEVIGYMDKDMHGHDCKRTSGMLIKGSESHQRMKELAERKPV